MFKTIDLFAGAGGLSLGLEAAGFKSVLAVELDRWAAQTFSHNFPDALVVNENITEISPGKGWIPSDGRPALIAGGPPCQGFSHSNLGRDPNDPRNSLFVDFLNWVDELQPHCALIENVPGLLRAKTGAGRYVIDVIAEEFQKIGYQIKWRTLQSSDYGVPQNRERLFIVAAKSEKFLSLFNWPHPTSSQRDSLFSKSALSLWDAISDLPENGGAYLSPPLNEYQKEMRKAFQQDFPTHHEPMKHTARIIERFKAIGYGESEASVGSRFQPHKRGGEGVGKAYGQNSRRQDPSRPCNTIVASSHTNFVHPHFHRNFTVRELMRIQSFPDDYAMCGKRAVLSKKLSIKKGYFDDIFLDQRMQVGNAVPPLMAKMVGVSLINALARMISRAA